MATSKMQLQMSDVEKLPLADKLAMAEELRELYLNGVRSTEQVLDPTALRELDVSIATARAALGMPKKGKRK